MFLSNLLNLNRLNQNYMERILLSTYVIKIFDKKKNDQILSHFNGENDFYDVFENYLNSIFRSFSRNEESPSLASLHLTLDSPPIVEKDKRRIYGYFSSGVSGEEYNIIDTATRERVLEVKRNHGAFRNIFFYIQMPTGKNRGALILQRKAKFGIKTVLKDSLNKYFRDQGFLMNRIFIDNILHGSVYRKMLNDGNLKKVEFIRKKIPATIEEYYKNNEEPVMIPGILKTSMISSTSLPREYKRLINDLFTNPNKERIEISGIDEEFDEIEFELELDGKKKSFYIANRSRIQPDIDVTSQVEIVNGSATLDSLIAQSEELMDTIFNVSI